ncbi:sialidase family protein [Larkinella rosea]|uniref:Exo-alpha-sialidase n=1 Tax=Larkinella rosea TaxID=2025312 RepID=A0A3P1BVE6_9BACT|nr:sialidase family protein [Larkinella rosea]RRB04544.1 exo-alpha-sialidase [Larkinella rosea]
MKNSILIAAILLFGFAERPAKEIRLSNPQFVGATPRLTTDHRNNPVLSWTEKEGEKVHFYFAVSEDGGRTFGEKNRVNSPAVFSTHAEGMPKVAFKKDGTILATFEVSRPTAEAPRAGDLLFVTSTDGGQTWTEPKAVHRDVTAGKGHSFSNLNRLPNGEIGIAWLDEKAASKEGRTVKFTQTLAGGGFGKEVLVDDNACQCCRTNVFVDTKNQVHIAYRDLLDDGARDISHAVSADGGRTFTSPKVVFNDQWKVNACPHTGPDVAQVGNDLFVTWFSGGEKTPGIKLAKLGSTQLVSGIISERTKHPQVASVNGQLVWVWDESMELKNAAGESRFISRIGMRKIVNGTASPITYLTPTDVNAVFPVLLATKKGLLVAYEQQKNQQNSVIVSRWIDSF